jgi:hypothetical protein
MLSTTICEGCSGEDWVRNQELCIPQLGGITYGRLFASEVLRRYRSLPQRSCVVFCESLKDLVANGRPMVSAKFIYFVKMLFFYCKKAGNEKLILAKKNHISK